MSRSYYRLLPAFAASLSLLAASCTADKTAGDPAPATGPKPAASTSAADMDTDATLWTILGLAKENKGPPVGPHLGPQVSPSLWQAAHQALSFVKITAEDPESGMLRTDWYSPPGKPEERLRVTIYVLSIALRSDSLSVGVEREVRSPTGEWQPSTVDREVVDNLYNTILLQARHLHAEEYRKMM